MEFFGQLVIQLLQVHLLRELPTLVFFVVVEIYLHIREQWFIFQDFEVNFEVLKGINLAIIFIIIAVYY